MSRLYWLDPADPLAPFPPAERALRDPNGLLALGGDLEPERLLRAYRNGIFPWYNPGQPILWWSPDPRCVLDPERLHVSRSLRQSMRNRGYVVRADTAFAATLAGCAGPRANADGTWLSDAMQLAYAELHRLGHAHSIECWQDDQLVGGLYGVALGAVFFGESMWSAAPDASKVALTALVRWGMAHGLALIDCQVCSPHLERLGALALPRTDFLHLLDLYCRRSALPMGPWQHDLS